MIISCIAILLAYLYFWGISVKINDKEYSIKLNAYKDKGENK